MLSSLKLSLGTAVLASGLGLAFVGTLSADDSDFYRADRKIRGMQNQYRGSQPASNGAVNYYPAPVAVPAPAPAVPAAGSQAYRSFSQDPASPGTAAATPHAAQGPCHCAPATTWAAPQPPAAPAPLASNNSQTYRSFSADPAPASAPAVQSYQPMVRYKQPRASGIPDAGHKVRGLGH